MGNPAPNLVASMIGEEEMVPLDRVRTRLGALWLGLAVTIFLIVVIQSLIGHFGDNAQDAWGWLLPTVMPTLAMIITVLGYTALDPKFSDSVVRKSFFWTAFFLSATYLVLILITILIQPFIPDKNPIELMHTSNLWLGPFQGLVASALGVLFVSKQKKNDSLPNDRTVQTDPAQNTGKPIQP